MGSDDNDSNGRRDDALSELQQELAFQGETLLKLDAALGTQQEDLLLLRKQVQLLGEELRTLKALAAAGEADDDAPPPHY